MWLDNFVPRACVPPWLQPQKNPGPPRHYARVLRKPWSGYLARLVATSRAPEEDWAHEQEK